MKRIFALAICDRRICKSLFQFDTCSTLIYETIYKGQETVGDVNTFTNVNVYSRPHEFAKVFMSQAIMHIFPTAWDLLHMIYHV